MEFIIIFAVMMLFMWLMTRGAKKAQAAQIAQREEAIVVGNNVVTTAGFFGRIVDIDGDAVTLESPSGDETVWLRTSIMAKMDVPLAEETSYDESIDGEVTEPAAQSDLTTSSPFEDDSDHQGSAWK